MKVGYCLTGTVLGCLLIASSAPAQSLRQPLSVRPASVTHDFDYYYYADEEEPSPSDMKPKAKPPAKPPAKPTPAPAPAPVPVPQAANGHATLSDCDGYLGCDSCGNIGCCGSCNRSCCFLFGPDEPWTVFPNNSCWGIHAGFWTQIGYHSESTELFNNEPDQVNLHQQWFYLEKEADGSRGWDWGFRFDAVYGIDGADTQAFGNEPGVWDYRNGFDFGIYSWALPQAYLELAAGDVSVKLGHFYTLVGYEVVPAPDNFFYSHSFTMYLAEPFTHSGAIVSWNATDNLEVHAGWTAGWDTGFDQPVGASNFLGGFNYDLTDNISFAYITTIGNFGWRGDGYAHSAVLDVSITERLNYVLQSDFLATDGQIVEGGFFVPGLFNDAVGINQYLIYELNECWGVGARAEWFKIDGVSINEATFGLNYKPAANIVFRPEIREQWAPAVDYDEFIFGIDAIVTY